MNNGPKPVSIETKTINRNENSTYNIRRYYLGLILVSRRMNRKEGKYSGLNKFKTTSPARTNLKMIKFLCYTRQNAWRFVKPVNKVCHLFS